MRVCSKTTPRTTASAARGYGPIFCLCGEEGEISRTEWADGGIGEVYAWRTDVQQAVRLRRLEAHRRHAAKTAGERQGCGST